MRKTLNEIANWLNQDSVSFGETIVTGVSIDTRTISEGNLFVPFRGESVNGHKFVEQAFEKGAGATLWLKDEPNPPSGRPVIFVENAELALQQMARAYRQEHQAKFIGVTGSNGKTSSKDILASMLTPYYKVQKTMGNFNNELGLPLTILSLHEDTEIAVLEMGMSGFGEIDFLSTLAQPHYVVITNIGEAHMQDLGSREGIAKAKFEIVNGLSADGILVYDGDEPLLQELVANGPKSIQYLSFGFHNNLALSAYDLSTVDQGSRFYVKGLINGDFYIPVLGQHQVKNTLNAMLIANALGLTEDQIRKGLQQVSLTNMRMQLVNAKNDIIFINDAYNAAPTSMRAAIEFVQSTTIRNEKWLVLGDMLELGENEQQFHEQIANVIDQSKITKVCLFGPRMNWLYNQLKMKFESEQLVYTEYDYNEIIQNIEQYANKETLILLKGSRGMKLETILNSFI
ncbi:UDP-N-acetylmuramoyl-tripeptide--D-alanyl-D-alanine ligase [Ureibacillus sp. NPDC094379]